MTRKHKSTVARSLAKYSLLALIAVGIYTYTLTLPAAQGGDLEQFEVVAGESVRTIAANLKKADIIRSPLYFRWIVRRHKLTLQAGTFLLSPAIPPAVIAEFLTQGKAVDRKITIPEGYRAEQIAETANLPLQEFLVAAKGLEGQLFPDTYFVKEDVTAEELVSIMHSNFVAKAGEVDRDTLILASLVERETRGDSEKPVVAGILKKRLAAGWALELDATVQYFLGKTGNWWPTTTLLDRRLASPYNTYLHRGLPPGPICNPGLASIQAVQNSVDSPYWFYLHDKTGTIRYAETNAQHTENINSYIH